MSCAWPDLLRHFNSGSPRSQGAQIRAGASASERWGKWTNSSSSLGGGFTRIRSPRQFPVGEGVSVSHRATVVRPQASPRPPCSTPRADASRAAPAAVPKAASERPAQQSSGRGGAPMCAAQQLRFYFLRPAGGHGRGAPAPRRPHVGREHRCSRWPRRVNEKRDPQQPRSPNASSGAGARAGHFHAWRRELGGQRGARGHWAVLRPSLDRSACPSEPAAGRGSRENGGLHYYYY